MEKITNTKIFIDDSYKNIEKCINDLNNGKKINDVYDKVLVITDTNVYKYQFNIFIENINHDNIYKYIIKSGESSKSLEVYEDIIKYLIDINLSRKSLIVALGGGVVGDLAGYVSSTYMRGIDFIQVPTTLLSQVDSSIGAKNGINLGNLKNVIGTFYEPIFTYINISSLDTLDFDEFKSGLSEIIKYGVIYDYDFLLYLRKNKENILNKNKESLLYIIKKSAYIKSKIVKLDKNEKNLRKILNFGHTFGHSIDNLFDLSHGYSVSIGMNMAFKFALNEGFIDNKYYDEFLEILKIYELPFSIDIENKIDKAMDLMKNDKKSSFENINLILPNGKGSVFEFINTDDEKILKVMRDK